MQVCRKNRVFVLVFASACAAGILAARATSAQESPAQYVILVSIDGLRPDFYLDDSWPAPFLQRMAREGSFARRVRGVFPSLTYPSHTTIATGALPIRHGVFYNSPFEPNGPTGLRYWSYDSIRVETIWEAARKAGLSTATIHWPVTLDAPIDYDVPEAWPLDPAESRRDFLRRVSRPLGLIDELEREATGRLVDYDSTGPTERWRYRFLDEAATKAAAYLVSVHRPRLLTLHLLSVDDAEHGGIDTPLVREAVAAVDAEVSYLWESIVALGLGDRTVLIVLGDHGFVQTDTLLAPNVWLVEAGLLGPERNRGDWSAAFHINGGAAFLHLRSPDDGEILQRVELLLRGLPESVRNRFDVLHKPELTALGADTSAALALAARPGTAFSRQTHPPAVLPGDGATHGYLPDATGSIYTGLIARGAGIARGGSVVEIDLTDVAPLVAFLLGLDFDAPDGRLPKPLTTIGAVRE